MVLNIKESELKIEDQSNKYPIMKIKEFASFLAIKESSYGICKFWRSKMSISSFCNSERLDWKESKTESVSERAENI